MNPPARVQQFLSSTSTGAESVPGHPPFGLLFTLQGSSLGRTGDGGQDVGAGENPVGPVLVHYHQDAVDVGIDHFLGQLSDRVRGPGRNRLRGHVVANFVVGGVINVDHLPPGGEKVDRLTAVKEVLDDFLSRRKGDRVGLILFGSAPFVQVPFTEDLGVCRELLAEAQVKMAGPQTAFGDALGLAISVFDRSQVKQRVLIALDVRARRPSRRP